MVASAILLIAAFTVAGSAWYLKIQYTAPGPHETDLVLVVPEGAGVRGVARQLTREGVMHQPDLFVLMTRLTGADRSLQAGEFLFPRRASMKDVVEILRAGKVVLRKLTIPEGLTSLEIVRLLEATDGMTGDITEVPPEGTLLPETYYFVYGDDRNDTLQRMSDAMSSQLELLWPFRADNLPIATPREAVILASIVERETALPSERTHVAGVYINRLNRNMRLQADPTVAYGLGDGLPLERPLTYKDLRTKTPYNTYVIRGLPPHPIANPGVDSLAAVLNPLETQDLYFVADGTGGHVFARTLAEHNRNVARWRKLNREKKTAQ